jgi:hypothetical protein
MAIIDERDNSDVKDVPLNLVVLAVYSSAFIDEHRVQYTRAFELAHASSQARQSAEQSTSKPLTALDLAETSRPPVTLSDASFCIPSLSVVFPRPGCLRAEGETSLSPTQSI